MDKHISLTPCTHEAELFVCDICGEDFAKYIVSRKASVPDVSTTQDVLIDIKTRQSVENTNPDYYKQEQTRIAALSTRIAEFEAENKWLKAKYERLKAIAERVGLIIDNANDEFLRELQSIKLQQKRGPDLDEWGNRRHSNE